MSRKVFIGGLDERTSEEEVRDFFRDCGKLASVWVARRPPGFGFIEFEDYRDAEDACKKLDGRELGGKTVRVEVSDDRRRSRGPRGDPRDRRGSDACFNCGQPGHFARECRDGGRDGGRSRRRSPSPRGRSRSAPRYRSRSPPRRYSRSPSPRDRSPPRRDRGPRSRSPARR